MVSFRSIISGLAFAEGTIIDWDKVTDFQTDFTLHLENVRNRQWKVKSSDIAGHLQLDLANEIAKVHMTAHTSEALTERGRAIADVSSDASTTLVVDSSKGYAYYKEDVKATQLSGEASFCAKFAIPPGMLPPGSFLTQRLKQMEPRIEGAFAHFPGTTVTSNGVVTYEMSGKQNSLSAPAYYQDYPYRVQDVKITTDGTPAGAAEHFDCLPHHPNCDSSLSHYPKFDLEFSNWQKGAGVVTVPEPCVSSSTSLTESPSGMSLVALNEMGLQLSQLEPTRELGSHLMELASTMREQVHSASSQQGSTWHSIAVPFAAGMSGAAAVFAFVKILKGKQGQDEYLLSQA